MTFFKPMKVIALTDFEDHFAYCLPNNIWSHHMDKLGIPLAKWNYKHSHRYSKTGGLEVLIKFRPSMYEILFIHGKRDYIEFSYFTRDDLRSKPSLPDNYCKMFLDKPWHEKWPDKTLQRLFNDTAAHKPCHKPILF